MDDMSNIMDKLSGVLSSDDMPDNIKELINGLKNSSSNNTSNDNSQNSTTENNIDIDMDMLFKAKKIMDSMSNTSDPRKSLLLSLKPYLKTEKKEKIDQYVKFLSLSKILETMGPELFGSDKNVK